MNKLTKVLLSILAGLEAVFSMVIPIIVATLFVEIFNLGEINTYLIYGLGLVSTLFRAIRIGWMRGKKDE
jgi:hypothetical protein